jgi:polyisoprenoid-binding protein YceI
VRKGFKVAIAVVAVVVLAGVGGYLFYALRDDAPPPEKLTAATADCTAGAPLTTLDGTWTVVAKDPTVVRYRVNEVLTGIHKEAAGGTAAVNGSIRIGASAASAGSFTVDMTTLKSNDDRRDNKMRTIGLETAQFATATFTLTKPIEFGTVPAAGATTNVTATGDLTLHGVTKSVDIALQAIVCTNGGAPQLEVLGTTPIVMADYAMSPPDIAGFVTTEDHGTLEVHLFFART